MTDELWKDIPTFDGLYQISTRARVRRIGRGRGAREHILATQRTKYGYDQVFLWRNNRVKAVRIHQLVMWAFDSYCPGRHINHIDGNKLNNSRDNLEWTTPMLNNLHKINVLKSWGGPIGAKNWKAIRPDISAIRAMRDGGASNREIARTLGIRCHKTVAIILRGEHWSQRQEGTYTPGFIHPKKA